MVEAAEIGKVGEKWGEGDRAAFWRYCRRVAGAAAARARAKHVLCTIDARDIDKLLVDQKWRCAVSGIALDKPHGKRGPFTPSLDRIVPALGYVPGNVRVVCEIINLAMNQWGEEPLRRLVRELRATANISRG